MKRLTSLAPWCLLVLMPAGCGGLPMATTGETDSDGSSGSSSSGGSSGEPGGVCGDGVRDEGEECDDGNAEETDACTSACKEARCGDGITRTGEEECDDGDMEDDDACTSACKAALCGDGIVRTGVEACDDGNEDNNDACTNACAAPSCGDGVVQAGVEECDDGNADDADACLGTCLLARCGDGIVHDEAEACDDGNDDNTDACTNACVAAGCGDGIVQAGVEECDDGNTDDTDGCLSSCVEATCGDGVVQAGVEACDDGNEDDTDACLSTCVSSTCGDGVVDAGVEACDDGDDDDTDACLSTCIAAACGDGLVHAGVEACDDGGTAPSDGCEADCTITTVNLMLGRGPHTCVVLSGGKTRCWGTNDAGQLGYGFVNALGDDPKELPLPDVAAGGPALAVALGAAHTCGLLSGGKVRCWGANDYGQLGYGHTKILGDGPLDMPTPEVMVGGKVLQLVAGAEHTCALLPDGKVRCWGRGDSGRLGLGSTEHVGDEDGEMPPADVALGGVATQLAAGARHTCALMAGGKVRCWGAGDQGQLGYGNTKDVGDDPGEMPPQPLMLGEEASQIAAGGDHTCVVLVSGNLRCWGANSEAQLGSGGVANVGDGPGEMPPVSVNLGGAASSVSLGVANTCALLTSGKVRCWGSNERGVLGTGLVGTIGDSPAEMPPKDLALGGNAAQIRLGADHACARLVTGKVRCWGANDHGQLGLGSKTDVGDDELPTAVPFVSVY